MVQLEQISGFGKQYLFVCGCPRSGTTAMWNQLASDPRIVLGPERYGTLYADGKFDVELFVEKRFFALEAGDTFYDDLDAFDPYYQLARRWFAASRFVGDKIPCLYRIFDSIEKNFPSAKIVFMLRNIFDVAASYEARASDASDIHWRRDMNTAAAIAEWKESLEAVERYVTRLTIKVIPYERFFRSEIRLREMYDFIGLPFAEDPSIRYDPLIKYRMLSDHAQRIGGQKRKPLTEENLFEICTTAPFELYRRVLSFEPTTGAI